MREASLRQVTDLRKPGPGMLKKLMADWPVDVGRSLMIGDRDSDIQAASAAGIAGYKFEGGDVFGFLKERVRPR